MGAPLIQPAALTSELRKENSACVLPPLWSCNFCQSGARNVKLPK